jgi:hypothetical protein
MIDTYGYIYEDNFNPLDPFKNLPLHDDNSCTNKQFKLIVELNNSATYVLVVTTSRPNEIGNFSILVSGSHNINLNHNGEYLYVVNN